MVNIFEHMASHNDELIKKSLCNAWVMNQIDYVRTAKRINEAYVSNKGSKLVLFEYNYDPRNNHFATDFIPNTDILVNTHVRSNNFQRFCQQLLTNYNLKINVYVRRKVIHSEKVFHPFIYQVVMMIENDAFDDIPSPIAAEDSYV